MILASCISGQLAAGIGIFLARVDISICYSHYRSDYDLQTTSIDIILRDEADLDVWRLFKLQGSVSRVSEEVWFL